MLGNEIIVSADPKGVFLEGFVDGALKPGTLVQVKASTEMVGGNFTYGVFTPGANGDRGLIIVLLADYLQGKLATDAYTSGDRARFYCPAPGEFLNMLIDDIAGTGDDWAIGAKLIAENGSGKLIATTGTPESEPFQIMETVTDPTADHLALCLYTGC